MSRIMDARHHPFDVLFGSLLGILCAWGAYRQYFPPVSHVWEKGRAYPIRSWGMPIKRPVPGKVMVDSQTLEILDDRVAEGEDGYDTTTTHTIPSQYELGGVSAAAANRRPARRRGLSLDMDLETGYAGPVRQQQQPYPPVIISRPSPMTAFREQMEHNHRMRTGGPSPSPSPSPSPGRDRGQHDEAEDDDDRRPLHSARLEA